MTDRVMGFTVTLAADMREDDADVLANAIRQLRGVVAVDPVQASPMEWIARQQARMDLSQRLWQALKDWP